jgi:hypothetical protein
MDVEQRRIEALESIADDLHGIHMELMVLSKSLIDRSQSSFGR